MQLSRTRNTSIWSAVSISSILTMSFFWSFIMSSLSSASLVNRESCRRRRRRRQGSASGNQAQEQKYHIRDMREAMRPEIARKRTCWGRVTAMRRQRIAHSNRRLPATTRLQFEASRAAVEQQSRQSTCNHKECSRQKAQESLQPGNQETADWPATGWSGRRALIIFPRDGCPWVFNKRGVSGGTS